MILWLLVLLLLIATVAGSFARWWWVLDLASHFRLQYLFAAAVLALITAMAGEPLLVLVTLALAWGNLATILPLYARRRELAASGQPSLKVYFHNVYERNRHPARVAREARASDADVVALIETDAAFFADVRSHLPDYPHFLVREGGPRTAGVALLCRPVPVRMELVDLGAGGSPAGLVELDFDGARIAVVTAHPLPPHRESWFHHRNAHLARLADFVRHQRGEVVLVGDLNLTSWSSNFPEFLERSGLSDSRIGLGVHPTWPSWLWPARIPIDHALVSSGLETIRRTTGGSAGSDHLSLSITVTFRR